MGNVGRNTERANVLGVGGVSLIVRRARSTTDTRAPRHGRRQTLVVWCALSTFLHAGAVAFISARTRPTLAPSQPLTLLPAQDQEIAVALAPDPPVESTPAVAMLPRKIDLPRRRPAKLEVAAPRAEPPPDPAFALPPDATQVTAAEPTPAAPPEPPRAVPPPPPAPLSAAPIAPVAKLAHVTPEVAKALREYDAFPSLPGPMRLMGTEHVVVVDICVSDRGSVDDVLITEGATDLFDSPLRAAIRTWRYRPLMVSGTPTPFCHVVRIDYRVN